jgi:hypothetical protein
MATKKCIDFIGKLAFTAHTPTGWPRPRDLFNDLSFVTCSESLLYAGQFGAYLLQFLDIDEKIKGLLIDLLYLLEGLQSKEVHQAKLVELNTELVNVLSNLEGLLPLTWCTRTRHYLLHITTFIERCGPFKNFSMLSFERWHTHFKKLFRGTRNMMVCVCVCMCGWHACGCYFSILH